jgi:hypothetical protein
VPVEAAAAAGAFERLVSLKGSLFMMNSSKKLSWVPRKGMNLSPLKVALLLLRLDWLVQESLLLQEFRTPLEAALAERTEERELGQDLRLPRLLWRLEFSWPLALR